MQGSQKSGCQKENIENSAHEKVRSSLNVIMLTYNTIPAQFVDMIEESLKNSISLRGGGGLKVYIYMKVEDVRKQNKCNVMEQDFFFFLRQNAFPLHC